MIKKLNIALVLVFGLMMLGKLLRQDSTANSLPEELFQNSAVAEERSELSPRVYYVWSPPFCKIDPLSKHNGFVLDQLRAIFPRAEFVECGDLDQQTVGRLRTDPRAVACLLADSVLLTEFPQAVGSPAWIDLHVLTPRAKPWKYRGPESLKGLRLSATKTLVSSRIVQKLAKERGFVLTIMTDNYEPNEKNGLDGHLEAVSSDWSFASVNTYSFDYENYRRSPPIGRLTMGFFANNIDTNFAAAVIRDFDAGFKRLRESGERQRICEYYGFQN